MKEGPVEPAVSGLEDLLENHAHSVIYRCVAGSRAYGTARPESDEDIRGIFILPRSAYLSLEPALEQVSDERNDIVYYTLARFLQLASVANPNIVELLFMPEDCVLHRTRWMDRLLEERELFITRQAFPSHTGYALAQIKRAKGRNKWVNNPQPEGLPGREEFCWVIPRERGAGAEQNMPYRPIPLRETGIDLAECHCAGLEHCPGTYRLYHYGSEARGVFRKGVVSCESIPIEDEWTRFVGLLIYDRSLHEKAKRDHQNYWEWRRNRNEARWQSQEQGAMDYDAKNMMHTIRLLLSGEHLLRHGAPLVRFEGEKLQLLRGILDGEHEYDELLELAERKVVELEGICDRSSLPENADRARITELLREITDDWEAARA